MKNTTFVSAGAGSGKTYSLTQEIARMVSKGKCQAEQIILTTFTEAAANELREKVRSTLYSKGLYEAAMNIDNAAIGTIHSIAYQFVSRYWYLLGISANVSIMDNEGSKFCISQSLASLPSKVDMDLFDNVLNSFNVKKTVNNIAVSDPDFWKKDLKNIIDKTVELCIDEKQLERWGFHTRQQLNDFMKEEGIKYDPINQIYHIVHGQNITVRRHFCMQGNQHPAGAVIVDDQIMNTNDTLIRHNDIINLLNKFRIRCLPQQRTDGILSSADTGKADEQPYNDAAIAVNLNPGKMSYQSSD